MFHINRHVYMEFVSYQLSPLIEPGDKLIKQF